MNNEHIHPIFQGILNSLMKHYFCAPDGDKGSRFCTCGKYLTDEVHIRANSETTDAECDTTNLNQGTER